ncbi:efflux RND transporter permease subunit [Adhaeribacter soli]|uniref:MMPL family transporter n=1 Tax=Adhaeribacter soli TaxID=2607655 RepID=A0A5N1IHS5_9BACT|nr:MMPL family transporter [Adhaeribacter soli]KAA9325215.1 MMPL family transporter [Adhaeribacter soli]
MPHKKICYLVIAVILAITGVNAYHASQLQFDYDFDHFFPQGDEDLAYYNEYRALFGNDNDYILLGIDASKTVFEPAFLAKIDTLSGFLNKQRHIAEVVSPTTLKNPVIEDFGVFEVPYLHPYEPVRLPADSALIFQTPGLINSFFSEDSKSISIALKTSPNLLKLPADTLMQNVNAELARLGLTQTHVAGKSVAESIFVDRMQSELAVLMSLGILLLIVVLWLTFRTWWGVVLPLTVVLFAIVWGLAMMRYFGASIDLMTVLLPTMMFVVGMSDVMHILTRYVTEIDFGTPKMEAIKITLKESGFASLLTSITTSVGFFSLVTSPIGPISNFGLYTGTSVLLTFVLAYTLLPAMMILLDKPKMHRPSKDGRSWFDLLSNLFRRVVKHRLAIMGISAGFIIISLASITKIQINSTFLEDLSDDDPVKQDFLYFEEKFAGVRPFEMHLKAAPGKTIYDLETLRETEEIENYLSQTYGLNFMASPVTVVKALNRSFNVGSNDFYKLPETEKELKRLSAKLKLFAKKDDLKQLISEDGKNGRLTGKMPDVGSAKAKVMNTELNNFITKNTNPNVLQTRLTGTSLLMDKNGEDLTTNMMLGMGTDILIVVLIALGLFRSFRMALITIIPNLVPILMIGAVMGIFGVNMKVSTSIIFTIAFGIAIDDTIHFISKFKLVTLKEPSLFKAIRYTFKHAGKAIIINSSILVCGFFTLLFSSFDGTFYTGLLIGLTLIFGIAAEIFLLPVLLLYFYKPAESKKKAKILKAKTTELVS